MDFDCKPDSSEDFDLNLMVEQNQRPLEEDKPFEMIYTGGQPYEEFPHLGKICKQVGEYVKFKYEV